MNDSPNALIEALKIVTEFLSSNSIAIVVLFLLFICRNAISSFIFRLTSLSFKRGESTLGMEAAAPYEGKPTGEEIPSSDEKPTADQGTQVDKVDDNKEYWFADMHKAFTEKRFDDAETIFRRYVFDENDDVKLEQNRAIYLYFRFVKANDDGAIGELEDLARIAKTEDSRFNILEWLAICHRDRMQYKSEIELWRSVLQGTLSEPLQIRATVNLADALNKDGKAHEAKTLLVQRLSEIADDSQKSPLYASLSLIEQTLGNKTLSIYCKDKSLEFDANNRDELFNSAYAASNEDIDEISISNYIRLLRIANDDSTAINNLGVRAQEAGLSIIAVENYKKSSSYSNTLAMANQGYLLLGAGFTDEAEKLANSALALEDTHQNVHSLIAAIIEKKQAQSIEWKRLQEKSLDRQKSIRKFVEQYYVGDPVRLKGDWLVNNRYPTTIVIQSNTFEATWVEPAMGLGTGSYEVELKGKVSGSALEGQYTRKKRDNSENVFLGLSGNINQACFGQISDDGNEIRLIATKLNDSFTLNLFRPQSSRPEANQN